MKFIEEIKRQRNRGRCLHFDSGKRCNEIINAHSIQRKHLVEYVAVDGHAYKINADYKTLKNNNDKVGASKVGVRKNLSTFLGFCKKHDNEVFKDIDDSPLIPLDKQVMLYAYRCLCREYFVKENSINVCKEYLRKNSVNENKRIFIEKHLEGTKNGFSSLEFHKKQFDKSLREKRYNDIEYVAFFSEDKPIIYFSGNLYPDFDFLGNPLQDLAVTENIFQLLTFFSAPTNDGWAYVFAWHRTSTAICRKYLQSLATSMHKGNSEGDTLFRLIVSCCENHAISPAWWENLLDKEKDEILNKVQLMVYPTTPVPPRYLVAGLEGIAKWKFINVQTNY